MVSYAPNGEDRGRSSNPSHHARHNASTKLDATLQQKLQVNRSNRTAGRTFEWLLENDDTWSVEGVYHNTVNNLFCEGKFWRVLSVRTAEVGTPTSRVWFPTALGTVPFQTMGCVTWWHLKNICVYQMYVDRLDKASTDIVVRSLNLTHVCLYYQKVLYNTFFCLTNI